MSGPMPIRNNNSNDSVSKIVEYASKEGRLAERKSRFAELTDSYSKLEEANKCQAATIEQLQNELKEVKSLKLEAKEVNQYLFEDETEKSELIERIKQLEAQVAVFQIDLAQVPKPTSNDLSKTLKDLEPLHKRIQALHLKINETRNNAHTTRQLIWNSKANEDILKDSLTANDFPYYERAVEYFELNPEAQKALTHLKDQIALATRAEVKQDDVITIAQMNYLQLDKAEINKKTFKDLLLKCNNIYNVISETIAHIEKQFAEGAKYLNKIDHDHGCYKKNSWGLTAHQGDKFRYSPTTAEFDVENARKEIEIMKGAEKKNREETLVKSTEIKEV